MPATARPVPTAAPAPSCGPPAIKPLAMPGPKIDRREHGERGENQRESVVDGRRIVEAAGELAEDRRADADDDGEHEDLHPGRDDVAEHLLGEEGGAAEEAERHQDEAGQVVSLNSIRLTKSWIAMMKKLMTTISQAISRMAIWTKLSKKLVKPISPEIEVRIGCAGVDADLGELAGLKKLRRGSSSRRRP